MSLFNDRVYVEEVSTFGSNLDHIRSHLHLSWSQYRSARETFKHGSGKNYYWFMVGGPFVEVNQMTFYEKDHATLKETIEMFWDLKQVHMVLLGGAALNMANELVSRGYIQDDIMPLMAYSLSEKDSEFNLRDGLEVRKVESEEDLDNAALVLSQGFDFPLENALKGIRAGHGRESVIRYILLDQGVPVSTALVSVIDKTAGCFEVTTPPQFRKKGYGFELMKGLAAARFAKGDELILLQASPDGEPLYRKAGYKVIDYAQGWSIHDPEKMQVLNN